MHWRRLPIRWSCDGLIARSSTLLKVDRTLLAEEILQSTLCKYNVSLRCSPAVWRSNQWAGCQKCPKRNLQLSALIALLNRALLTTWRNIHEQSNLSLKINFAISYSLHSPFFNSLNQVWLTAWRITIEKSEAIFTSVFNTVQPTTWRNTLEKSTNRPFSFCAAYFVWPLHPANQLPAAPLAFFDE